MPAAALLRRAAGVSGAGRVKNRNEDSGYAGTYLYAVADGLGGHVGGQVASAAVIDSLRSCDVTVRTADLAVTAARAIAAATDRLAELIQERPELAGMGTTLTAMLWSDDHALVAHIGDSRAYLLRAGELRQITEDHVLGKLVSGLNGSALAPLITRYLDGRPERSPDLTVREVMPGDRYLICSDGLTAVASAGQVGDVLATVQDPEQAARRLMDLANEGGGPDNITVLVIDAGTGPLSAEPLILGAAAGQDSG